MIRRSIFPVVVCLAFLTSWALTAWGQAPPGAVARSATPATAPTTSPVGRYGAERYRLVNEPNEIVSVLENGLTVIAKRVPSPAVSVRGYIGTGGVYEGRWLGGGLSHLLEHLVAGGSTQKRTEAENRALLQAIGNNSNAYTSADHTAFFINTTPEHMEQAVDLLSGWLFGALITPEEYAREYQVVQRELEMGKGEPARQFWYMSQMNRYHVSPARVPVIGYQSVIQGLSRDDVYEYYQLAYEPSNMVFAVVGNIDPETILATVQKYVGDQAPKRVFSHDIAQEPPVLGPRTLVATAPKIGQTKLELEFPSVKLDDPDMYPLDLLAAALGQGESSLLVEQIRDKQQLVSMITASDYTPEYATGSFSIYMQLEPDNVPAATKAVLDLIEQVKEKGIDKERLERAKSQVRASRVKGMQTAEQIAASMATDYMSTGDPHFSDRYVQRMEQVTPEQVQAMARKYLDTSRLITTAMLPAEFVGAKGLPRAEDLIRQVAPTTRPTVEQASPVTRVELGNGTILLLKRITTSPLVVMHMYSLGGLTAEDQKTNGLGNLAMELLPRGTKNQSAEQIATFWDSIGGDINTSAGNNTWSWTATALKESFPQAIEAYADIVNNPSFPEAEVTPMKQRVLAAIASQDASWSSQAMRYFKRMYFGPSNSPYQFQTIGTQENVSSFTRQQAQDWYNQKVLPSRRVLAIYGDIDIAQARQLAERHLGGGQSVSREAPQRGVPQFAPATQPSQTPTINVARVEVQQTQQPLAGVIIGFDARSVIGDPANYPLAVGKTMTGGYGYPTGYLHETLRGRGLVYVVHDANSPGRSVETPGTFFAYAGCDPRNVNQVVDLILENIARLQGTAADMQEDWFDRSKQLIVTSDAMENETAAEQATTAALDELFGLGYDYHDKFAQRINAVSLPQVQEVARQRLRDVVVTISTPAPDLVQVKTGERRYESFPPVELTPRGVQHETAGGAGGQ